MRYRWRHEKREKEKEMNDKGNKKRWRHVRDKKGERERETLYY